MVGFANAKINIGLQIIGRRSDGYHLINTVMYPLKQLSDVVEIVPSRFTDIVLTGFELQVEPQQNLVFRAYELLRQYFDLSPVTIYLHKNIPHGAGLGGGSSDAATVLKLLNDLFSLGLSISQLENFARQLGADCAFFIKNKPAYARNIGDELSEISLDLSRYNIVVVKPGFEISTAEAYSMVKPRQPGVDLRQAVALPVERWKDLIFNDFEFFLFKKYPELGRIKQDLYRLGALYASLSGSGSAVYGIFDKKIDLSQLDYAFVWQKFK